MTIWVTSDTHFGHANIIKYADRPFKDVYEMDKVLIENWNRVVKPEDTVIHVGDVYMHMGIGERYISDIMRKLNGQKRLILGNHDKPHDNLLKRFTSVKLISNVEIGGLLLIFTHMPLHRDSFELTKARAVNVHGHIHHHPSPAGPYINVCVEHTNYTPVSIDSLYEQAAKILDKDVDTVATI